MVTVEYLKLSESSKEKLLHNIKQVEQFLERKFPKFTIGLCFLVLFLILFIVSQHEDYGFAVFLKLATIFPLTGIVVVLLSYFHKRGDARKIQKFYNSVLKQGSYKALRVESRWCGSYKDGLSEYFLFDFDKERQLLLRLNDFAVNRASFPNDNFIVPPYELLDVVGNEIVCAGNIMENNEHRQIGALLRLFESLPRGQTMVIQKT